MSTQGSQEGHQHIWKGPITYHTLQIWAVSLEKQFDMTFKARIAIWKGPIAYLVFIQFWKTSDRPLYVSYSRSFCDDLQGWNHTRLENDHEYAPSQIHSIDANSICE